MAGTERTNAGIRLPENPNADRHCTINGMPYTWPARPLIINAAPMTVQPIEMATTTCNKFNVPTRPEPTVNVAMDTQPPNHANR